MTKEEIMALEEGRPADGHVAEALGWRWLAERHCGYVGGGHEVWSEWRRFLAPPGWEPPPASGMEFRDADGTETLSAVWYCRFGDLMVPRFTGDDGEALRLLFLGWAATRKAVLSHGDGGVATAIIGFSAATGSPRLAVAKAFLLARHAETGVENADGR